MASTHHTAPSRHNSVPLRFWQIMAVVFAVLTIIFVIKASFLMALVTLAFAVFSALEGAGRGILSGR